MKGASEPTRTSELASRGVEIDLCPRQREPRRVWWIWFVYVLLFAIAIPWYWPPGFRGPLIVGLPMWSAVTVGCAFLLAVWTGVAIRYCWVDDDEV